MCSEQAITIQAQHLSKTYMLYDRPRDRLFQFFLRGRKKLFSEVAALNDVSLTIRKGETVGIIGRNGSGKSTLLQMICGILTPSGGALEVNGRISALLELGAGFNPEFTGRENVFLNGAILGLRQEEIAARFNPIVEFSGIGAFIDRPVKTYSSGMFVRLAFAVAVATDPDILVVDEALAVGDEAFQRKCYARIREMKERGATILFVSHALGTIVEICDRALLIDQGALIADGEPKRVAACYQKMIYAPPPKQAFIRADIMREFSGRQQQPAIKTDGAALDPDLVSESAVFYTPHGGEIRNPRLLNAAGDTVNLLHPGKDYIFAYDVTMHAGAEDVKFGMLIKTLTGIELGGAGTESGDGAALRLIAGEKRRVEFHFRCTLLAGTYFLNCGFTRCEDGEEIFVHRILDACQFRVLPKPRNPSEATRAKGLIDFAIQARVMPAPL